MLIVVLNLAAGTAANTIFAVSLDGASLLVAPIASASGAGQLTLTRAAYYDVGTTVSVLNQSSNAVTLAIGNTLDGGTALGSAGHLSFFKFADGTP